MGRFFFDAWGQTEGFLDSGVVSPVDGISGATFTVDLGAGIFPSALLTESSGKFLYVQTESGLLIYFHRRIERSAEVVERAASGDQKERWLLESNGRYERERKAAAGLPYSIRR